MVVGEDAQSCRADDAGRRVPRKPFTAPACEMLKACPVNIANASGASRNLTLPASIERGHAKVPFPSCLLSAHRPEPSQKRIFEEAEHIRAHFWGTREGIFEDG